MLFVKTATLICLVLICNLTGISQIKLTADEARIIKDFESRAKAYVELRERVKKHVASVKKDATPAEVEAYKDAFQKAIQTARVNAKKGDIFTPDTEAFIKTRVKTGLPGFEKSEIRAAVLEADTTGVPIKVNAAYPESKELVAMPPPLLLLLPQLPPDLRYRFIGRSLAVMDRDNSVIVDYMRDALP